MTLKKTVFPNNRLGDLSNPLPPPAHTHTHTSCRYTKYIRQVQILHYHLFRSVFLRLNRSLLTPAFDFAKYSGAIVDEIILFNFDIDWRSWLGAMILLYFTVPITLAVRLMEGGREGGYAIFGEGGGGSTLEWWFMDSLNKYNVAMAITVQYE